MSKLGGKIQYQGGSMSKLMKVFMLIVMCFGISGCLIYGKGEEVCYVSAVDDELFWAVVYTKTDLASSDADSYIVEKGNDELRGQLLKVAEKKQRIKIKYKKHFMAAILNANGDEIYSFEVIN